jgi:lambda repressor-like predicted transcriptional regulator
MVYNLSTSAKYQKLLNYLREEQLSLRYLSSSINISPSLLSLMMHGKRTFQERHKIKIVNFLGIPRKEIFND